MASPETVVLSRVCSADFPQLAGKTYLDHAGSTLYSAQQLQSVFQDLQTSLYANPHSLQAWSPREGSAEAVTQARQLTLELCSTSSADYECIFTCGATGALKLLADCFPWQPGSQFAYTRDNHNSVLGMREVALEKGASVQCTELASSRNGVYSISSFPSCRATALAPATSLRSHGSADNSTTQHSTAQHCQHPSSSGGSSGSPNLFALPVESNFSGVRYDLELVKQLQQGACQFVGAQQHPSVQHQPQGAPQRQTQDCELYDGRISDSCQQEPQQQHHEGQQHDRLALLQPQQQHHHWFVLLDAAKACGTAPPDLTTYPADFVALSYYKIFGYPTGLGALLVRRTAMPWLQKSYFGGGTVEVSAAEVPFHRRRPGAKGLEDGTADFLSIAALRHGFAQIATVGGMPAICKHTAELTRHTAQQLAALAHPNGRPAIVLYGCHDLFSTDNCSQQQSSIGVADTHRQPDSCTCHNGSCMCQGDKCHQDSASQLGSKRTAQPQQQLRLTVLDALGQHTQQMGEARTDGNQQQHLGSGAALIDEKPLWQDKAPVGVVGQGPVVTFSVVRADGSWVGYREVEKLAALNNIHLRTGCFCNPGACAMHLGLSAADLQAHHAAGHVCWDDHDVIDGRPTGAVRVSFGYMSTMKDVETFLSFICQFFTSQSDTGVASAKGTWSQQQGKQPSQLKQQHHWQSEQQHQQLHQQHQQHQQPQARPPNTQQHSPEIDGCGEQLFANCPVGATVNAGSSICIAAAPFVQAASAGADHSCPRTNQQVSPHTAARSPQLPPLSEWLHVGDHVTTWGDSAPASTAASCMVEATPPSTVSGAQHTVVDLPDAPGTLRLLSQSIAGFVGSAANKVPWLTSALSHPAQHRPESPASTASLMAANCSHRPPVPPAASMANTAVKSASMSDQAAAVMWSTPGAPQASSMTSSMAAAASSQSDQPRSAVTVCADTAVSSSPAVHSCQHGTAVTGTVQGLWLYPVKSCAAVTVAHWPLGKCGLMWDREWALVDEHGKVLTQKKLPRLALIKPQIDLDRGVMQLSAPGVEQPLVVLLVEGVILHPRDSVVSSCRHNSSETAGSNYVEVTVCTDTLCGTQEIATAGDAAVSEWLYKATGRWCRLIRQRQGSRQPSTVHNSNGVQDGVSLHGTSSLHSSSNQHMGTADTSHQTPPMQQPTAQQQLQHNYKQGLQQHPNPAQKQQQQLSFANEGQLLLLNAASLSDVAARMAAKHATPATPDGAASSSDASRFRPNILVGGVNMPAYSEDYWQALKIGQHRFSSSGGCTRCEMVCMDQSTGKRMGSEPLLTLASYRRSKGRIKFGLLLNTN